MTVPVDAEVVDRDPRADMLADWSRAQGAFNDLRRVARSAGAIYGDALGLVLERRLEAAQERYEDALNAAERLIGQPSEQAHPDDNEEPF